MQRSLLLFTSLLLSFWALAQQGTITGTVTALENGTVQPQPFVNVSVKGTSIATSTDLDGRFTLPLEAGQHTLVVSFVGFTSVERAITVAAGQTQTADVRLESQVKELGAFKKVKERKRDTEGAVLMDIKNSEQVANGVGRQQIAKGQDRTAGDVVKRIPGVTIVNDRFVMIRGLADRYNTVLLNDATAPSMEADKRAFSFDLIPSGALDRVMIYKTGAPELPGDFAGGTIAISTVSVPEANETKVTYGTGYRVGTTLEPFFSGKGSSTDALGFDNGTRILPDAFPGRITTNTTPEQLSAAGRSLENNWVADEHTALPDQRFGLLLARRFGKGDKTNIGTITAIDYSNTAVGYDARNVNYNAYDQSTGRSDTIYNYLDKESIKTVRASVLHNWSVLLGTNGKLEFRNLFNQIGEDRTTLRTGRDLEGGNDVRNYNFRYQQRTIYTGQLHGNHAVGANGKFDWTLGYGLARSKEPDVRRLRTYRALDQTDSDTPYTLVIPPGASRDDAGRFFSELSENAMSGKLDYAHTFEKEERRIVPKLRVGAFIERKDRSFEARWMSFVKANITQFDNSLLSLPLDQVFADANINSTTGFKLTEGTNPSDRYTAANSLFAGYAGTSIDFNKKASLSGGVRLEHNRQQLNSARNGGDAVVVDRTVTSILPSVNAAVNISSRALVRAAYSTTVNRPEFRELAPFSYYDFSFNNVLFGNEELEVARIQNMDLRWEFYPTTTEVVSVGVFHKIFHDPIEMYFIPGAGSGGTRNFSFRNAESATSTGAELEVRRSLNGIFTEGYLSRLGVSLNATVIHSVVDLGGSAVGQAKERPMMGQSPYVINAGVFYTNPDKQIQYNVQWNVFGRRLFAVGTFGTGDLYEMPRNSLDATITKGFGKHWDVKVSAQDILNQRVLLQQDSNEDGTLSAGDQELLSYRRGTYFSGAVGFKF